MLPIDNIVRIAVRQNDGPAPDLAAYTAAIDAALKAPEQIPTFSRASHPLDLVRFRCLLQDSGYPAEVYLPEEAQPDAPVDWSKLQERWVGWAVEIPGEQPWAELKALTPGANVSDALAALSLNNSPTVPLPPKGKFPTAKEDYTGALLKVYDSDASFRPASAVEVIGIVSAAPLPAPFTENENEDIDPELVPCIHVLLPPASLPIPAAPANIVTVRAKLIDHLASAFNPPDKTAAELLLLALIAYPAARPGGLPLGTLSINLIRSSGSSALVSLLESLAPTLLPLEITLLLLHGSSFRPSSDGNSLSPGLLQLAPGTLLLINEDGLGAGGALAEKALKNVQALSDAIGDQSLRYDYPYTDGVRIETALRSIITSEGKSLLPADVHVPVSLSGEAEKATQQDLDSFRAYLGHVADAKHAERLNVPDAVGDAIQDTFVADRKAGGSGSAEAAEARLRRRMKIARLMATSYPAAELTKELWERTVALDADVEARLAKREEARRQDKIGQPIVAAANHKAAQESKESK